MGSINTKKCELPFCKGIVEGSRNKRRCDKDRNIHLHKIISQNVKKIMKYIETKIEFTANDVARDLFKNELDKNQKGSMYRLFKSMIREGYIAEKGKKNGLKLYCYIGNQVNTSANVNETEKRKDALKVEQASTQKQTVETNQNALLSTEQSHNQTVVQSSTQQPPVEQQQPKDKKELLIEKLREFVYMKNGSWNHDDWLWLINRPDIKEFGLPDDEVGLMLEAEKAKYWAQKNQ